MDGYENGYVQQPYWEATQCNRGNIVFKSQINTERVRIALKFFGNILNWLYYTVKT
jgi:hypothetical protein